MDHVPGSSSQVNVFPNVRKVILEDMPFECSLSFDYEGAQEDSDNGKLDAGILQEAKEQLVLEEGEMPIKGHCSKRHDVLMILPW